MNKTDMERGGGQRESGKCITETGASMPGCQRNGRAVRLQQRAHWGEQWGDEQNCLVRSRSFSSKLLKALKSFGNLWLDCNLVLIED